MGLPAALKAHANKDYNTAAHHYQRALEQKSFKPELFQNYGALLRQLGQIAKAKSVYEQGIKLYPKESAIFRNYANLIREEEPVKALAIYFNLLHADFADPHLNECDINFLSIIQILLKLKKFNWALDVCKSAIKFCGLSQGLAIEIVSLLSQLETFSADALNLSFLEEFFASTLGESSESSKVEFLFSLCGFIVEIVIFEKLLIICLKHVITCLILLLFPPMLSRKL